MNKSEYKAKYSALRAMYNKALVMVPNQDALDVVWDSIKAAGLKDVFMSRGEYRAYPIQQTKWAVHTNHRGY